MKVENLKTAVLLLDDDHTVLNLLKISFSQSGLVVHAFTTAEEARAFLSVDSNRASIKIAIVDLFLQGDRGDHLSNNFIENELIPAKINYCRLTSAPRLVPAEFVGLEVFDKRDVLRNVGSFLESLERLLI